MKKIILAIALSLSACANIPVSPAIVANTTTADEQIATYPELTYKAWRLAVETAVHSGMVKPGSSTAIKLADTDNKLYAALQIVRAAYNTGNATSYAEAIQKANAILAEGYNLIGGKRL